MALDAQTDISDDALMVLYANGDRTAAYVLTHRITPRIVAYASRVLSSDRAEAEDVAQETMLRLWRIAPDWRPGEAKVTTWAYRVATNLCTDKLRSGLRRRPVPLDDAPEIADPGHGVVAEMVIADRREALAAALDQLPRRQRQVVVLRNMEGLSNPDIADIMGLGIEAVESLNARGKRSLTALLAHRKPELGYEDD